MRGTTSSDVLLVLAAAAHDVGDVVAFVFVGLEEGIVLGAVVGNFDLVLTLDGCLFLAALGLGIRVFERNELDLGGLRSLDLGRERNTRRHCRRSAARTRGGERRNWNDLAGVWRDD